jgi:hypothetical protein
MHELLATALDEAATADEAAELVKVIGFGVDAGGRVDLDLTGRFQPRWEFAFRNPNTGSYLTVSWYTRAFIGLDNPVVTPNAGNVVDTDPIVANVANAPTTDQVVSAHAAATSCEAFTGADNDTVIYYRPDGQDVITTVVGGDTRQASFDLQTELIACQ